MQVAKALADIRAAHVIHKDINANNVVYTQETGALSIIDFGLSVLLSRETASFALAAARVLEGTLQYILPEQTGGTNRSVDYRTDLYSFGVVFRRGLTSNSSSLTAATGLPLCCVSLSFVSCRIVSCRVVSCCAVLCLLLSATC